MDSIRLGEENIEIQSKVRSSGLVLLYLTPVSESPSSSSAAGSNEPVAAASGSGIITSDSCLSSSSVNPKSGITATERDCLTYCFPPPLSSKSMMSDRSSSSSDAVIAKLKGMFLTLSHVVNGITDQKPIKSFITVTRRKGKEEKLHQQPAKGSTNATRRKKNRQTGSGGPSSEQGVRQMRSGRTGRRLSGSNLSSDDLSEEVEDEDGNNDRNTVLIDKDIGERAGDDEEEGDGVKRSDSNTDAYSIAYVHEYTSILVIALSHTWHTNLIRVSDVVAAVARMIRFRFESLDAGFKNPNNHPCITHHLNLMMSTLINDPSRQEISSLSLFSAQKLIMDDDELNLTISEILSEYEAKDWLSHKITVNSWSGIDSVTMFAGGSCGDFVVAGVALFHRGLLIQSHLSPSCLNDMVTYLNFTGLLRMSAIEACSNLVHWIEVHPNPMDKNTNASGESSFISDFPSNEGSRFFLLAFTVKQTLMSVLLEVPFLSIDSQVLPNETFIQQSIRFLVSNLQRSGVMDQVEDHIDIQSKCQAVRIEQLNETLSREKGGSLASASSSAIGSLLLSQQSKGNLRNRIKSLSLRDLFHNASTTFASSSSLSPSQQQQQPKLATNSNPSSPITGGGDGSQQRQQQSHPRHQRRSLILSLPIRSVDEDENSKSCSTPSLVHHASPDVTSSASSATGTSSSCSSRRRRRRRSSATLTSISSGRSDITSSGSTISSLSEAQSASLFESEISDSQNTTTSTTATTTSSASRYSSQYSLSFRSYFEEQRRRLPDNLIMFIDQDCRSGFHSAPLVMSPMSCASPGHETASPTSGRKLSSQLMRAQVIPEFRSCCLHLRDFIRSHYPLVREYGMHFWITPNPVAANVSPDSRPDTESISGSQKKSQKKNNLTSAFPLKGKVMKQHEAKGKGVISFWAAVRKESSHREVYACFLVSASHKKGSGNLSHLSSTSYSNGLNISMESLSYSLSLQHREI